MKTFKIYTLGCKVNQYDAQEIRERFLSSGFSEINGANKAGLYIVNTCTVTSRADTKSSDLIRHCLRQNSKARVLIAGCMARQEALSIKKTFGKRVEALRAKELTDSAKGISDFEGHSRAFIKIQDGCNNHCAYCKVALMRGISRSRNLDLVIKEALALFKKGFLELVLC